MRFLGYRPTTGNFPNELATITVARLGWKCFWQDRVKSASSPDPLPLCHALHLGYRQRFRGQDAGGAGAGMSNRHWTTAFAASAHSPMPFKANPAAGGVDEATSEHYLLLGAAGYPGGPLRGR